MSKKILAFIFVGLGVTGSVAAYLFYGASSENSDEIYSATLLEKQDRETAEGFADENQEIDWEAVKKKQIALSKEWKRTRHISKHC